MNFESKTKPKNENSGIANTGDGVVYEACLMHRPTHKSLYFICSLLGMMEERVLEELGRKMVNNGLKEKN